MCRIRHRARLRNAAASAPRPGARLTPHLSPRHPSLTAISRNPHRRVKTATARPGDPSNAAATPVVRKERTHMETLVPAATCQHARIRVTTGRPMEFIDLTDRIEALIAEAGIRTGLANIQSLHTTTAIVVNEHEPLLLADFAALLARAAPKDEAYRHDDMDVRTVNVAPDERPNGHAHCHALLLGS